MMSRSVRALAMLAAMTVSTVAMAQTAAAPQDRVAAYSALAKYPDFSGVWGPDWSSLFPRGAPAPDAPGFTPAARKAMADFKASQAKGENTQTQAANCIPPGMPQIMTMPYPIEFLFTPGRVTIFAETDQQTRRVYTDGRKFDDPDPTFNGTSTGHWEGDTLVVETTALNPQNTLLPGLKATETTKLIERIKLENPDRMVIETTMIDPALFTQPYTRRQAYLRKKDWEIREYVCAENNKDGADELGRPSMDIK